MPRIGYPDPDQLAPEVRKALSVSPINIVRMMAGASPEVFLRFGTFAGAFFNGSTLPPRLREIAILRVGHLSQSRYEVFQHEEMARNLGFSRDELAAIASGGEAADLLGRSGADVLAFTDDVVRNVRAGDATLEAVGQHLDRAQVLDLILVIGCYMMVCRLLETTGVELDGAPINWDSVPQG